MQNAPSFNQEELALIAAREARDAARRDEARARDLAIERARRAAEYPAAYAAKAKAEAEELAAAKELKLAEHYAQIRISDHDAQVRRAAAIRRHALALGAVAAADHRLGDLQARDAQDRAIRESGARVLAELAEIAALKSESGEVA